MHANHVSLFIYLACVAALAHAFACAFWSLMNGQEFTGWLLSFCDCHEIRWWLKERHGPYCRAIQNRWTHYLPWARAEQPKCHIKSISNHFRNVDSFVCSFVSILWCSSCHMMLANGLQSKRPFRPDFATAMTQLPLWTARLRSNRSGNSEIIAHSPINGPCAERQMPISIVFFMAPTKCNRGAVVLAVRNGHLSKMLNEPTIA